jgi:raffinose/stachyose/melibiose transport system substrate-binding protein
MRLSIILSALLLITTLSVCDPRAEEIDTTGKSSIAENPKQLKQIILTMGSWRQDDVEQINVILRKFTEKYPHIVIKFDPTPPSDYNDVIEMQLESETAPDLFYLRSFSHSKKLFKQGYLEKLNSLAGLKDNFPPQMLEAWSTDDGMIYGVPLMAVSHGIYYNVSFFKEMNIAIPETWEELLVISESLKQKGIVPFANATADAWTINGLILQNVIPSLIGGMEGRLAYYNGERCFNDEHMVASFQAVKDISPYVSSNHNLLKYADSLQLFIQGKSPMWFGGSWDIPFFEAQKPDFEWSIFAIPPRAGDAYYVTFHPDAGIGLNQSSPYINEAKLFLEWMTTSEFASLLVAQLPGFFPMHKDVPDTNNAYANIFLSFNKKYPTDSRFVWGAIRDGKPSAYDISLQSSVDVMNNIITPQQAAEKLQEGLSQWFEPASRCPKK